MNQAGVKVSIAGTNQSTLTDAEVNYSLPLSEAGSYYINAELKGYACLISNFQFSNITPVCTEVKVEADVD